MIINKRQGMNLDILLIYSFVSFFYIISPGPAVFLALTNGMTRGMKVVCISSLGNIVGLFLLSAISISGLGAILTASATLFMMVKVIGAAYLIFLGIKQFKNAKKTNMGMTKNSELKQRSNRSYFMESFLLAATNPKPIVFFIAFFPQFLNLKAAILPQFLVMTGIFMLFSFFSLCVYGFMSKSAKHWFSNEKRMQWFHKITGGLFIGMGVTLFQFKSV